MDSYTGQIRIFGGPYAPSGWAFCNGATLAVNQHQALFALIGTTYGGNGTTTFALPNLQLTLPVGVSPSPPPTMASPYPLGGTGGTFNVTLGIAQIPPHTHAMNVIPTPGTTGTPGAAVLLAGVPAGFSDFANPTGTATLALSTLSPAAIGPAGGGLSHFNGMPSIAVNYIICLDGLFPQFS